MPDPSLTPPPAPPANFLPALFQLREAPRRWPFALRAAAGMGLCVAAGALTGDMGAGLLATIGAFTALYGGDRPYLNRAIHLAIVALSFAASVTLGIVTASHHALAILAVAAIAAVSTFVTLALRVGPPGAYLFALSCAAGTSFGSGRHALESGLYVLAGGAVAWCLHMAGALADPRGPERVAVRAAAESVARFIESLGTPGEDNARHAAALALHDSWAVLVSRQPAQPRPSGALTHLRALNRRLHFLFAQALTRAPDFSSEDAAQRARALGAQAAHPPAQAEKTDPNRFPLGHPSAWQRLAEGLRFNAPASIVARRVGLSALVAGFIGAELGLERAYWIIAAAVLVLHQGLDWLRTLQRAFERVVGTFAGLLLAGGILALHPQGLALAATLFALQFVIEMAIVRNYALTVIFITAAALTIAAGGHPVPDVAHLLLIRAEDTLIGCGVALLVYFLTISRVSQTRVRPDLARTLDAIAAVIDHLAARAVTTPEARLARRNLQHRTVTLLQSFDAVLGSGPRARRRAEHFWPAVVATQRLAYRITALCWSMEQNKETPPLPAELRASLAALAEDLRANRPPGPAPSVPAFLAEEVALLWTSLR